MKIPIRFYYHQGTSTTLLWRLCRFCYDSWHFDQNFESKRNRRPLECGYKITNGFSPSSVTFILGLDLYIIIIMLVHCYVLSHNILYQYSIILLHSTLISILLCVFICTCYNSGSYYPMWVVRRINICLHYLHTFC